MLFDGDSASENITGIKEILMRTRPNLKMDKAKMARGLQILDRPNVQVEGRERGGG